LIHVLRRYFAGNPNLYISGNMLMYYVEGDKHKHVSPDVFVVRDIPDKDRDAYFLWEEGKGPDFVVEFTSKKTRKEDLETKFNLYRDILHVREYFLFDPKQQYLKPSMKGYRLVDRSYVAIELEDDRLPSEVLGLHLERQGTLLRLYDPLTRRWVETDEEAVAAAQAEVAAAQAEVAAAQAEAAAAAAQATLAAEVANARATALRLEETAAERDRLLEEVEVLRRQIGTRKAGPHGASS
jgi:Uma2 family endonuclease